MPLAYDDAFVEERASTEAMTGPPPSLMRAADRLRPTAAAMMEKLRGLHRFSRINIPTSWYAFGGTRVSALRPLAPDAAPAAGARRASGGRGQGAAAGGGRDRHARCAGPDPRMALASIRPITPWSGGVDARTVAAAADRSGSASFPGHRAGHAVPSARCSVPSGNRDPHAAEGGLFLPVAGSASRGVAGRELLGGWHAPSLAMLQRLMTSRRRSASVMRQLLRDRSGAGFGGGGNSAGASSGGGAAAPARRGFPERAGGRLAPQQFGGCRRSEAGGARPTVAELSSSCAEFQLRHLHRQFLNLTGVTIRTMSGRNWSPDPRRCWPGTRLSIRDIASQSGFDHANSFS